MLSSSPTVSINSRSRKPFSTNALISALSWLAVFGANPAPAKAGGDWNFDQPEGLDALLYLRDMQEKGCLWAPKFPTPYEYFGGRKTLFYMASIQDVLLQAVYQQKIDSQDEWIFIPFPGSDGEAVIFSYGSSYALLRGQDSEKTGGAARQMAAWLFVRWMSQAENQVRLGLVWGSLPVSEGTRAGLNAQKNVFPWNTLLGLESEVRPLPSEPNWRLVRRPLEDAFWHLFNLASADQVTQLLPALDQMAKELIQNQK